MKLYLILLNDRELADMVHLQEVVQIREDGGDIGCLPGHCGSSSNSLSWG